VFVPTGGDDTLALQQAIVDHPVVRIDAPVIANGRIHLQRLTDRTIEFGPAGVVRRTVLDRSWASLSVFNLTLAERVTVVNPRIEGAQPCDADGTMTHVQATNKQHAFDVRSSIDVTIIGGYAKDLGGDGIYTSKLVSGAATPGGYYRDTTNLTVWGFSATCMGRNALSFTSDVDSKVVGGTFGPTGQYVIDVEPDANMRVTGLRISGVTVSGPSAWLACPGISPIVDAVVERPTITRATINACRRITPR